MNRIKLGREWIDCSAVFSTYWRFAAERQNIYHSRILGTAGPWTIDPILASFRFTNAFRAADRVSQDLIKIQYTGSQVAEDVVLRTLIFRFFNKTSTWNTLENSFGDISSESFDIAAFEHVLSAELASGNRIYSAAYIIPPPPFGAPRKHQNHLRLVDHMMRTGIVEKVLTADSMSAVFQILSSYPSLGPFLAYQLTIDLNYSGVINFSENDFVVPGPGARSGLSKCFPRLQTAKAEEMIYWMVENQDDQFERLGLQFKDLFGRKLTLIDCQNLFCETDKYARVAHPESAGIGGRSRIKQSFKPKSVPAQPFFPPKWGVAPPLSNRGS